MDRNSSKNTNKNKRSILKLSFIIAFFMLLYGMSVIPLFKSPKSFSDTENRHLQSFPSISLKGVLSGKFQEGLESFMSDQFFMREESVSLSSNIRYLSEKKDIGDVYISKDGYLIEKYSRNDFDKSLVKKNIKLLSKFLNESDKYFGTSHVSCMLVPSKISVLDNKLPRYADAYSSGIPKKLINNLTHKDICTDLSPVLGKHKSEYIYYRTDHHWTTLGAYYAYCEYEKRLGITAPGIGDYSVKTVSDDFYGTAYNKCHIKIKPDRVEIFEEKNTAQNASKDITVNIDDGDIVNTSCYFPQAAAKSFDKYRVFFSKNAGEINIYAGGEDALKDPAGSAHENKTLLVIKDSFANCFVPFLTGGYDHIIMIDPRYNKQRISRIYGEHKDITDVLVLFNTEKFMEDTHLQILDTDAAELSAIKEEQNQPGDREEKSDVKNDEDDIFDDLISMD